MWDNISLSKAIKKSFFWHVTIVLALYAQAAISQTAIPPEAPEEKNVGELDSIIAAAPVIQRLENSLGAPSPDYASIAEEAQRQLKQFYTQATVQPNFNEKRIQSERYLTPNLSLDANARRLLVQARLQTKARPQFLRESPYLFRLHSILAGAYAGQNRPLKSINEYTMAWRYAKIEPPTIEEKTRLKQLQKKMLMPLASDANKAINPKTPDNKAITKQREERYHWMQHVFADPQRIKQEEDPSLQEAAYLFRKVYLNNQSNETTENKQKLENIRKTAYPRYVKKRRERQSKTAWQMALQIRRLELQNKELYRHRKRNFYKTGQGHQNLQEVQSLPTDFSGFRALVEFASKIDPFQKEFARHLADEYRRINNVVAAIHYTRLLIALAEETSQINKNTKPKLAKDLNPYIVRLAGLYQQQGNYIQAADAYEYLLLQESTSKQKQRTRKQLANLHYQHTGKLEQAKELWESYLKQRPKNNKEIDNKNNNDSNNTAIMDAKWERHFEDYNIHKKLATIARRHLDTIKEKASLQKSLASYRQLQKYLKEEENKLQKIEHKKLDLQRKLLNTVSKEKERDYHYLKNMQIKPQKEKIKTFTSHLQKLNFPALLERQALLAQRTKHLKLAKQYYREILEIGSGPQIDRARSNLQTITQNKKEGITPSLIMPPDFER